MKKLSLIMMMMFGITFMSAQTAQGSNWLKLGVHAGIPMGDAGDFYGFMAGIDGKYQFLTYDHFGLGVSTGYSHYFGKEVNGYDVEDGGVIPIAALLRYYPTETFFIGTDLGYGIFTGEGAEDGGFYYRPEIGYHNERWNIFGFYQGVAADGLTPSAIGVGVNFNVIQRAQ